MCVCVTYVIGVSVGFAVSWYTRMYVHMCVRHAALTVASGSQNAHTVATKCWGRSHLSCNETETTQSLGCC